MKPKNKETNKELKILELFISEQYGERGAVKREAFEYDYEAFKIEILFKIVENDQITNKSD